MDLPVWPGAVGASGQLGAQHLGRQTPVQLGGAGLGVAMLQAGEGQGVARLGHLDRELQPAPGRCAAKQLDLFALRVGMRVA